MGTSITIYRRYFYSRYFYVVVDVPLSLLNLERDKFLHPLPLSLKVAAMPAMLLLKKNYLELTRESHKVRWEDHQLAFDHEPFIQVNHKVYDCRHWVDRHSHEKKKMKSVSIYVHFLLIYFCVHLFTYLVFRCHSQTVEIIHSKSTEKWFRQQES